MAYEKLGRAGCVGVGIVLLVVGLFIIFWITVQPPSMFTLQGLSIIIPTGIVAIFCLIFAGSFLYTGIFYIHPLLRAPARACPKCGRILTALPIDIKNCPYCGQKLE